MTNIKGFAKAVIDSWTYDHNVKLSAESYKSLHSRFVSALKTIKKENFRKGKDYEATIALALAVEVKPLYVGNSFNMPTLAARIIKSDDAGKTLTVSGMTFYIGKKITGGWVDVVYIDKGCEMKRAFVGQYIIADGNKWEIIQAGDRLSVSAKY